MKRSLYLCLNRVIPNFAALLLAGGISSTASAQPLGIWTPSNIAGTNNWSSVAASVDGTRLVATAYDDPNFNPGLIFVSTNAGASWNATSAPSNFWYGVTSSTNGAKIAAVVSGGGIYTSTDGGTSWDNSTNAPYGAWYAIASSWDGSKLVAVSGGSERFIYTSPDSGQTWVSNNVPDSQYWYAAASSADGQTLFAVSNSDTNSGAGAIYNSVNGGTTWISNKVAGVNWTGVACSADARTVVACGSGSALYVSIDGGTNWKAVPGVLGFFTGAACSADGTRMVVISNGGQIYTSGDSGANWVSNNAPALAWQEVAASQDANLIVAAVPSDQIYTLRVTPALNFTSGNGKALLSWPWPSAGFTLEHNVDLSTTNWQPVANGPLLTNWQFQVTVDQTNLQDFFRLKAP